MKRWLKRLPLVMLALALTSLVSLSLAACSNAPATVTVTATPSPSSSTAAQSASLTIVKDSQSKTFTIADLKGMPSTSSFSGDMSSTGKIEGPYQYKGVSLTELLKAVGGITENNAVRVSAKDNYTMTLSYNQVTSGTGFPTFDSQSGKEVSPAGKVNVIIAYEQDAQPIVDSGPLRMAVMSDNQLTDGHWWEKWVQKIEVISVQKPFNLSLEGAITTVDDQATIESCSAPGCHGTKWTDPQGHVWNGVPLWRFVGSVDDNNSHGTGAFNDALVNQGYEVHVVGADGFIVKLASAQVKRNDNMIVAYQMDGNQLPDNQWPLRLVGSALDNQSMVGQVVKIKLMFPGATPPSPSTSATSTPTASGSVVLTVMNGTQTKTYSLDALKALTPAIGYGSSIGKNNTLSGPNHYKGVALMDLLNAVGGLTATNSIKITGSDGYTKTFTYDQVANGNVLITDGSGTAINSPSIKPVFFVAYEKDGAALDASTGPLQIGILTAQKEASQASSWVKLTAKIEVIAAQ